MALLEEVELSYVGLDRIAATAASLRDYAQGRLHLACLPALAHALLPDAIRRFVAVAAGGGREHHAAGVARAGSRADRAAV